MPEKYWEHYKGKVPMPVIPPGYLDSLPLNYQHLRAGFQHGERAARDRCRRAASSTTA